MVAMQCGQVLWTWDAVIEGMRWPNLAKIVLPPHFRRIVAQTGDKALDISESSRTLTRACALVCSRSHPKAVHYQQVHG
jgi:enterochelin esterase-like enzyme